MNICNKLFSLAVIAAFFVSCTASKQATSSSDLEGMEHASLDTFVVHGGGDNAMGDEPAPYQPSVERVWDLLHTQLDLSFDWKKEEVHGTATLKLTPLFYAQKTLRLDAVHFDIHNVTVDGVATTAYQNSGEEIIITLAKTYKKNDELNVIISYTAHPTESREIEGGAITSDRGLFFIDPQDTIPGLAMQIWSQGETTNNRKWYPTLDQPNERGTQEIILTVEDTMMTLSNGLLVSSTPLPGGMRRDDWKLDIPHAPYLAMIAVGKWDKVTDYWRGRPVEYYVDPGFGPSAKAIFANTPEMIEFFSTRLGFDFVWPKYAQIIVKDFVSGAMENSTAVVFGDFIEFNKEDMIEEGTNDYIVSHELFHHWFGDLVTCESWANITLNEGFANYAEYLWFEHKYGRERADISRISELSGYFDQTAHEVHPLIHYRYTDQEKMFDAHTYNKGGLVLHMLRDLVGDDAFFASLRTYLQQHAYESVEIDDLRQAFEEVTGKDLHWFFDQWYLGTGHPILDIRDTYDAASKKVNIEFIQTQDTAGYNSVFILPVDIAIYHQDSTVETQHIWLNQQTQTFSFDMADEPLAVVIDPRDILLAVVHQDIPESEYPLRAISNLSISHRISALRLMENIEPEVMEKLIADSSYSMRAMLVSYLVDKADADRLYEIAQTEKHADLQFYILQTLMPTDPLKARELALRMLQHTDKVPVIYAGLSAVAAVDVDQALQQLGHFLDNPAPAVFAAQAMIYAKKGNIVTLDFFTSEKAAQINEDYLEDFIGSMALFMSGQSAMIQDQGLSVIDSDFFLKTKEPQYRRFYLITGLLKQYAIEKDEVFQKKIINTIKSLYNKETDEYLRGVLKDGLGDLLN